MLKDAIRCQAPPKKLNRKKKNGRNNKCGVETTNQTVHLYNIKIEQKKSSFC